MTSTLRSLWKRGTIVAFAAFLCSAPELTGAAPPGVERAVAPPQSEETDTRAPRPTETTRRADPRTSFAAAVAQYRHSIFLLTDGRSSGTAFLIAEDPPLLATAAHVTDGFRASIPTALMNETGTRATVTEMYLHAGARRLTDGTLDPMGPDVAVVRLAALPLGVGPPFPLAAPQVAQRSQAERIASLGFPVYAIPRTLAEVPAATLREGTVSRLLDFSRGANRPPHHLWLLETELRTLPGQSGSPLFLLDGSVIGVCHALVAIEIPVPPARPLQEIVPYAVRVDALWELLADLHLTDAVRGQPDGLVRLHPNAVWEGPRDQSAPWIIGSPGSPGNAGAPEPTPPHVGVDPRGSWALSVTGRQGATFTIREILRTTDPRVYGLSASFVEYKTYDPRTKTGEVQQYGVTGAFRSDTRALTFTVDRGGYLVEKPGVTIHAPYFSFSRGPQMRWVGERPLVFSGIASEDGTRMEGQWAEEGRRSSGARPWTAQRHQPKTRTDQP